MNRTREPATGDSRRGALRSRAHTGAMSGLTVGVVFSLLATLDYASRGNEAFVSRGTSYGALVSTYLVGYPLAGVLAWMMMPIARSAMGAMFVGAVSVLPLMAGVRLAFWGVASWGTMDELLFGLGIVTGAYFAWAAHREWKNGRLGALSKDTGKR